MIIVLFHMLYLLGKFVYQSYREKKPKAVNDGIISLEERLDISDEDRKMRDPDVLDDYEEKSLKFFPPAYVQRYSAVSDILSDVKYQGKLRKVVDFGCSELGFLVYLKNTVGIEEILCVDVDRDVLESHKNKAAPLVSEYIHCRTTPLVIEICEGSVTDCDKKLEKTDAVVCIELIEHLYPDTLTNLPYNIFGYVKPKLVIITTPNADFNVLFPNFSGFRHYDHKFEWTRQQFKDWADNIILRYPDYEVTFEGICKGPSGTEHLGCCTQMAIFNRLNEKNACNMGTEGLFQTVAVHEYPFRVDNRSDEQKILDEAMYYIRQISYHDADMQEEVPLEKLLKMLQKFYITVEALRTILEEAGWAIMERDNGPAVLVPQLSTFSDYSVEEEAFLYNSYSATEDDEDWDVEPGPPRNYSQFMAQGSLSERWNAENWDEEPSIIIPQNNSVVEDNTYLFDGENASLDVDGVPESVNTSSSSKNRTENRYQNDRSIDCESLLPSDTGHMSADDSDRSIVSESMELSNSSIGGRSGDLKDISTCSTLSQTNTQPSVMSIVAQRIGQMLNFQEYMSVSRSSTSPEPFLLETIKMEQLLKNDSICNQSMSCDQLMSNTFDQSNASEDFNASTGDNILKKDTSISNDDDDGSLRTMYLNTSYEHKDSDSEDFADYVDSPGCRSKTEIQSVQSCHRLKEDKQPNDHVQINNSMSFTSISNSAISENSPIFTSSPKTNARINESNAKQKLSRCSEQTKSNILSKIQDLQSEIVLRNVSGISVSSASTDSSAAIKKWYGQKENPMYSRNLEPLKGGSPLANISSDGVLEDSDAPAVTDTSNESLTTEGSSTASFFNSKEDTKTDETLQIGDSEPDNQTACQMRISKKSTATAASQQDSTENAAQSLTENQEIDVAHTVNNLRHDTVYRAQFEADDQRMANESKSCMKLICDEKKIDSIIESQENVANRDSTFSYSTIAIMDATGIDKSSELGISENVDRIDGSYNYAKDISELNDKSLVSCSYDDTNKVVQCTSILSSKEQINCNVQTHEAKCKDVNLSSNIDIEETSDAKLPSPETLETPPNSWSPEIMDSGYPNSASAQDMTPEYDLSSIAQDHISDSESPSVAEAPRLGLLEVVEVENGDLANNNRDGEGNNMMAAALNDLDDLQPLIDVLENDLENENDIYALENDFPIWLLRILEMANPGDLEMQVHRDRRELRAAGDAAGDAGFAIEHDEGFDSSTSEDDTDAENNEMENDDNSNFNENAMVDNIENGSNSDSGSDQWAAGDT